MGLLLLFGSSPGVSTFIGVMVNTYREIGPLACYPVRARDADYQPTGAFAQEAWCLAQEPRRYISAKELLHVIDPAGPTTWTSEETGAPDSWKRTKHVHAVTNDEVKFDIEIGGEKVAEARPWHGYFAVCDVNTSEGKGAAVAYVVGPSNTHYIAYIDSDERVVLGKSGNTLPLQFDYQTSGFDTVSWVAVGWSDAGQKVFVWTQEPGGIYERTTSDNGRTYSVATTITSSGSPSKVCGVVGRANTRYVYWIDGSAVKGSIYDAGDNLIAGPFTAIASGIDANTSIDCDERTIGGGRHQIVLWHISSGSLVESYSDDGQTFT